MRWVVAFAFLVFAFPAGAGDRPVPLRYALPDEAVSPLEVSECPEDMIRHGGFCIDRYEAPNREGRRPITGATAHEGERWCEARGKMLCTEKQWLSACRGDEGRLYPYGARYRSGACNDSREWRTPNWEKIAKGVREEIERLDQSGPAGGFERCRTPEGVFDLTGNVAEWVLRKPEAGSRKAVHVMKGCYWSACFKNSRPNCSFTNSAHPGEFRTYEAGFRCCLTLRRRE